MRKVMERWKLFTARACHRGITDVYSIERKLARRKKKPCTLCFFPLLNKKDFCTREILHYLESLFPRLISFFFFICLATARRAPFFLKPPKTKRRQILVMPRGERRKRITTKKLKKEVIIQAPLPPATRLAAAVSQVAVSCCS